MSASMYLSSPYDRLAIEADEDLAVEGESA